MHVPVMLAECLEFLGIREGGVYGDLTLEPPVHVAAIAEIVQELVAAGVARDYSKQHEHYVKGTPRK